MAWPPPLATVMAVAATTAEIATAGEAMTDPTTDVA
jgi:hypothetical protein